MNGIEPRPGPTDEINPDITRLAVNINHRVQDALRHVIERDQITLTTAVDYLILLGAYIDDEHFGNGRDVILRDFKGDMTRLVLLRRKGSA